MRVMFQQQQGTVVARPSGLLSLKPGDLGCDVSSYQPSIDWPTYAASGRTFCWIKATEGTNYLNPYFSRGWLGSLAVGVVRGTYHFARPDLNQPEAEVAWFLQNVGTLLATDMLALDMEDGPGDLLDWTLRFLNGVSSAAGRKAYFYSGFWFMQPHNLLHQSVVDASAGLWYASYQGQTPPPPGAWSRITFWQHTSSATVPGIPGPVDESIFLG